MAKIIQHQVFYPHPPEVVWEYLTNPELVSQWLMPGDIRPVPGHEFQFTVKPMPEMDFDGNIYCKVLEVVPFKKLSYSWRLGPGNGVFTDSTVNWTLTAQDNGTQVLLVHRDFKGHENLLIFASMEKGWLKNMNKILQILSAETGETAKA